MRRNSKIKYFVSLGIIILFMIFGLKPIQNFFAYNRGQEDRMYLSMKDIKEELTGRIVERRLSPNWAGTYLFSLSNGNKFSLSGLSINNNYKKRYQSLLRSLQVGDSIYKPKNTDSVYVYRENERFYYIIGIKIE